MTKSKAEKIKQEIIDVLEKHEATMYLYNCDLTAAVAVSDVDGEVTLMELESSEEGFESLG